MMFTLFFVLGAGLPSATASKPKANAPDSLRPREHAVTLLSNLPLPRKEPEYVALKGTGGGLDVLEAKEEEVGNDKIYRPWKTRFDLQPYDLGSPEFLKPENRMGYRHFYVANPNLALAPNSLDRHAQATVEFMFGLTALVTTICGILVIQGMQVLDTDNLDFQAYQKHMIRVIAVAAAPWLLLGVWLLSIFASGVANPMRDPRMAYHWQCNSMAWFLLVAPLVNMLYFSVHALWISKMFFHIESQPNYTMGRMFTQSKEKQYLAGKEDKLTQFLRHATSTYCRWGLLILEVLCGVFGYLLVTFRMGANSQLCQPDVYWATNALVITVAIVIFFTGLTFACSICIGLYSQSPWLQDFYSSFCETRLLETMAKEEYQDARDWDAFRSQQIADAEAAENFDEWADFQQSLKDDHDRHQHILSEHVKYVKATSVPPPERFQEDKPLVVWDDEEVAEEFSAMLGPVTQVQSTMLPPILVQGSPAPTTFLAPAPTMFLPPVTPPAPTMFLPPIARQVSPTAMFPTMVPTSSRPVTVRSSSLTNVEDPLQQWKSAGFGIPTSAPALATNTALVVPPTNISISPRVAFG